MHKDGAGGLAPWGYALVAACLLSGGIALAQVGAGAGASIGGVDAVNAGGGASIGGGDGVNAGAGASVGGGIGIDAGGGASIGGGNGIETGGGTAVSGSAPTSVPNSGSGTIVPASGGVAASSTAASGPLAARLNAMDDAERQRPRRQCVDITGNPRLYQTELVELCNILGAL